MLTQTLRAMERDGLVARRVHAEVPPRVEYALTSLGASMAPPLKALGSWSLAHGRQVDEARDRFDVRLRGRSARRSRTPRTADVEGGSGRFRSSASSQHEADVDTGHDFARLPPSRR